MKLCWNILILSECNEIKKEINKYRGNDTNQLNLSAPFS